MDCDVLSRSWALLIFPLARSANVCRASLWQRDVGDPRGTVSESPPACIDLTAPSWGHGRGHPLPSPRVCPHSFLLWLIYFLL